MKQPNHHQRIHGNHRSSPARSARRAHADHVGHDKHADHSVERFRNRFWVCLVLTTPALIWKPMLQQWFGYEATVFPGSDLIPALFGSVVFS